MHMGNKTTFSFPILQKHYCLKYPQKFRKFFCIFIHFCCYMLLVGTILFIFIMMVSSVTCFYIFWIISTQRYPCYCIEKSKSVKNQLRRKILQKVVQSKASSIDVNYRLRFVKSGYLAIDSADGTLWIRKASQDLYLFFCTQIFHTNKSWTQFAKWVETFTQIFIFPGDIGRRRVPPEKIYSWSRAKSYMCKCTFTLFESEKKYWISGEKIDWIYFWGFFNESFENKPIRFQFWDLSQTNSSHWCFFCELMIKLFTMLIY